MYLRLAALDAERRTALRRDADAVMDAASQALRRDRNQTWVLDVGKDAHVISEILKVLGETLALDAAQRSPVGEGVGTPIDDYGSGRYWEPSAVPDIAASLAERLERHPIPELDEYGNSPDLDAGSTATTKSIAAILEGYGSTAEDHHHVRALTLAVARHYAEAAARGDGVISFWR